jgi:DNA repair protein SbcD/Mre11
MKVLHTSDWHIGKRLHKMDLKEDHKLFFSWLVTTITEQQIDLLLVAGDIFDTAYPSQESLEIYYDFLSSIIKTSCKVIVTGGNHDSPNTLNAPRELLKHLDIQVIGGSSDIEEQLIPVYNDARELQVVIAAVPYLRDPDLRLDGPDETQYDRIEQTKRAIVSHYRQLAEMAAEKYPGIPAIAMGHLFASGVTTSESERQIQQGNLAGIEAGELPPHFQYFAFGHIHKAQWIGGQEYIRYCGSPIALSFAEWDYNREVLMLETNEIFEYQGHRSFVPKVIPIPTFRKMVRLKGSFAELETQLNEVEYTSLPTFAEIEIIEEGDPWHQIPAMHKFVSGFRNEKVYVLNPRIAATAQKVTQQIRALEHTIDSIEPEEVFMQRIKDYSEEDKEQLTALFKQLLMQVQSELKDTNSILPVE